MIKSQTEHLILRTENRDGVVVEALCLSKQEALMHIFQSIEQLYKGNVQSLHASREVKTFSSDWEDNNIVEDVNNKPNVGEYQLQLLKQQILLFDREQDMTNFIQTEKCLAQNCVQQLTNLSLSLMKLCQLLLSNKKPFCDISIKEDTFSRQKLDKIESECLNTLMRVKEERKRIDSCCICLLNPNNMIIFPCMHVVLCKECGQKVSRCPICMQPITEMRQFFK